MKQGKLIIETYFLLMSMALGLSAQSSELHWSLSEFSAQEWVGWKLSIPSGMHRANIFLQADGVENPMHSGPVSMAYRFRGNHQSGESADTLQQQHMPDKIAVAPYQKLNKKQIYLISGMIITSWSAYLMKDRADYYYKRYSLEIRPDKIEEYWNKTKTYDALGNGMMILSGILTTCFFFSVYR